MEILCRNPAGREDPPGKGGNRPEASIGESSEMAASSVCSEHKSRVIEPRNIQIAGAFVFMPTGVTPERQRPSAMVRPGSKSTANVRKGSLGTWEILLSPLLLNQKRDDTGKTTTWHTRPDLAAGVSERAKHLAFHEITRIIWPSEPSALRDGFLYLCVLPSTVSTSVVLTEVARGNTSGAMFNAALSNILGVMFTPLLVRLLMQASGQVSSFAPLLLKITLLTLVPFVVGMGIRPFVRKWVDARRPI